VLNVTRKTATAPVLKNLKANWRGANDRPVDRAAKPLGSRRRRRLSNDKFVTVSGQARPLALP